MKCGSLHAPVGATPPDLGRARVDLPLERDGEGAEHDDRGARDVQSPGVVPEYGDLSKRTALHSHRGSGEGTLVFNH